MNYIVIEPGAETTSTQRAWILSGLLYDIVKHPTSVSAYLFNVIEHPETGEAALECDLTQVMPLQNASPLAYLVDELSTTVGVKEAAQWAESMIGNTVTFADLLPEGVNVYTREQMEQGGWFVTEEIGI